MKEKRKAPLARIPRLTRGQKLARNLICCVLLAALLFAGLLYSGVISRVPLPLEWRFRLAERSALLQPSEIVAGLSMEDAIYWDADGEFPTLDEWGDQDATAKWSFAHSQFRDARFLLGRSPGWLHIYESGFLNRLTAALPAGPGDVSAYLYLIHFNGDGPELAPLVVYSDLPAARVEAELAVRGEDGSTVLRGSRETEDGACLLIAGRTEEETPPEAVFEKSGYWLRVRLMDENGAVLGERSGNVEYGGGWTE